jgi:isopentenyl phosphate kinase
MTKDTKSVVLLKLGGAVITNKEIPNQLRIDVLKRLVSEIAQAKKEKDICLVLGNGVGSFAHVPASHYKTIDGFISDESPIGMAITQDSAARINRAVVKMCLEHELPAVTVAPSNSLVTASRQASSYFSEVFEEYMRRDLLPVTYGDVIADRDQGCTIWSTDTVFSFFARQFHQNGWKVDHIIHVTEADGVWKNTEKEIYSHISPSMREEVKKNITATKGFDVTGGMWHKIEESLSLTDLGIKVTIMSGLKPGNLFKALTGDTTIGTTISADLV